MRNMFTFPTNLNSKSQIIMLLCDWANRPEPCTIIVTKDLPLYIIGELVVTICGNFGIRNEQGQFLLLFTQDQILGVTLNNEVYIRDK